MIKREVRKPKVQKRHQTIRLKVSGTAEFPRLAVYRSTKHIYAQLIDDENRVTLASASSNDKELKEQLKHGGNIEAAKVVGAEIAKKAKAPIVVTTITNTNKVRRRWPFRRTDVQVDILAVIQPEEFQNLSTVQLGNAVWEVMQKHLSELA